MIDWKNTILHNAVPIMMFLMGASLIVVTSFLSDKAFVAADPFGYCTLILVEAFVMLYGIDNIIDIEAKQ